MFEVVDDLLAEYAELGTRLTDPSVHADANVARKLGKRYAELGPIAEAYREYQAVGEDITAAEELAIEDPAFSEEIPAMQERRTVLEERLQKLLIPRDPMDEKNVILEIKGGEGGQESMLFAGDLLRMYMRYAERQGWKTEVLESTESDLGGYKDVQVAVKGRVNEAGEGVWARLKYEGGVHRVQRVPVTESQGRIHTSAAGVLVLPEAEDVEVEINPGDLRIDVFRSSGPGGQSVNTTDSAVRITHLPTGIVVSCQNERSQIQNRASAMAVLQAKLLERRRQEEAEQMQALRGDGGRAWGTQIRNYVLYPYQNVKDVRTGMETGNAVAVLDGEIDDFIDAEIRWMRQNGR